MTGRCWVSATTQTNSALTNAAGPFGAQPVQRTDVDAECAFAGREWPAWCRDYSAAMPTAHLIYGYIGAGKTTFAKKLEQDVAAVRFSADEWITTLYGDDEAHIQPDVATIMDRLLAAMEPLWSRCLVLGLDVILDMGFWTRVHRDATRKRVEACRAGTQLYYVRCDDEVAWSRVESRNAHPCGSIRMVRNTFDVLKARVEPLGPDEPHLVIET
jgi:predicted kinase